MMSRGSLHLQMLGNIRVVASLAGIFDGESGCPPACVKLGSALKFTDVERVGRFRRSGRRSPATAATAGEDQEGDLHRHMRLRRPLNHCVHPSAERFRGASSTCRAAFSSPSSAASCPGAGVRGSRLCQVRLRFRWAPWRRFAARAVALVGGHARGDGRGELEAAAAARVVDLERFAVAVLADKRVVGARRRRRVPLALTPIRPGFAITVADPEDFVRSGGAAGDQLGPAVDVLVDVPRLVGVLWDQRHLRFRRRCGRRRS